jgi:hypothetical protein
MITIEAEFYKHLPKDVRKKSLPDKNQVGGNLYQISNRNATILVHLKLKETYWTIASDSPHGFKSNQAWIERVTIFMKDMCLYPSAGIIFGYPQLRQAP